MSPNLNRNPAVHGGGIKILSLDGGGVLGIGQAAILSQCKCLDKFDAVAGTSVGSIMAALVAIKADPDSYLSFFKKYAPDIFAGYWWRRYKPWTPRYDDSALNNALSSLLPGLISETKIPVFIPVADLDRNKLKVFMSTNSDDSDLNLWEVVRASVAAPTYFVPWKGYADGGLYANNPGMVAVAGAISKLGVKLEDVEIFSIGTGEIVQNSNIGSTQRWTHVRWGMYVLDTMLHGAASSMHEFFLRNMPIKCYSRVQFVRDSSWTIDNIDSMNEALKKWQPQIQQGIARIQAF